VSADHALVEVDNRAGHQAGAFGKEESGNFRDLRRLHEAAERLLFLGFGEPVVAGVVEFLLDRVLARAVHPADVEAVDADAVLEHGARDVAGQRRQGAFGGRIGRKKRLPAVARHAEDIQDRPGDAAVDHRLDGGLHQKEWGPHVDCEDAIEELGRGIEDGAALRGGGA